MITSPTAPNSLFENHGAIAAWQVVTFEAFDYADEVAAEFEGGKFADVAGDVEVCVVGGGAEAVHGEGAIEVEDRSRGEVWGGLGKNDGLSVKKDAMGVKVGGESGTRNMGNDS